MITVENNPQLIKIFTKYYLKNGYYFFVQSEIPPGKDLNKVDTNIISKYETDLSDWERHKRKKQGIARVQYFRYERQVLLVATEGKHHFFDDKMVKDCRQEHLPIWYYWIKVNKNRYQVSVNARVYNLVKESLLRSAEHGSFKTIQREVNALPWLNYPGVKKQKYRMLKEINQALKRRNKPQVSLRS